MPAKMNGNVEKQVLVQHFNDWPNAVGFDVTYEEHEPIDLEVQGHIPAYASGTLFRTGIGPRTVQPDGGKKLFKINHWFDAFSQVHRYQLHQSSSSAPDASIERVTYNSRLTSDGLIAQVRKTGKLDGFNFAADYDTCKSFFQKAQSVFRSATSEIQPNEMNNAVTISTNYPGFTVTGKSDQNPVDSSRISNLVNKTDAARLQFLDPQTLRPTGITSQTTLHPDLRGPFCAAHPCADPVTGDTYNYNLDLGGRFGVYRVYHTSASTGKTNILATISHPGAYLHSLFLTSNFVILAIWNSHYSKYGLSILWHKNILDAIYFNACPAAWFVIDRHGSGITAQFESPPFFAFHTVNAYEIPGPNNNVDITCDVTAYENTDVIHHFYMDNMVSDSPRAARLITDLQAGKLNKIRPQLRRYLLSSVPLPGTATSSSKQPKRQAQLLTTLPPPSSPELPTYNPSYTCKPYRFIYGATMLTNTAKSTFIDGLVKVDMATKEVKRWEKHGHTPGEAIFVARPGATEEDDGVLLSVVLDGTAGTSYLLCLDARTLEECGRVNGRGPVGFGFHGTFTSRL